MSENMTVAVRKISEELLARIKTELDISDNSPVLSLAINRDGAIIVGTGKGEFNDSLVKQLIQEITSVTPACIIVARGSTTTNVTIGGTSITHRWGP